MTDWIYLENATREQIASALVWFECAGFATKFKALKKQEG